MGTDMDKYMGSHTPTEGGCRYCEAVAEDRVEWASDLREKKNQDSIGWASDLWEKRNQDSSRVFQMSSEERKKPKIRKFG
ncbi:uncharacterized protein OCT59_000374 [Rhizophagus irregularis]|uniref:uncharacterized protein n=1 Tax=Rhizophagus irregularis TaxID=588596 RepID=UPI003322524A|nr:hypothetical protein OCT59_000374 [Rhizophagus irregularis]